MTVGYVRNVKPTVSKIRMRAKRTTKRERSR
jgi:hypothetical protein